MYGFGAIPIFSAYLSHHWSHIKEEHRLEKYSSAISFYHVKFRISYPLTDKAHKNITIQKISSKYNK